MVPFEVSITIVNLIADRTSQAITAVLGVLRSVSEMTLVSRRIKAPVRD
jgi:hypothetical protein